jgi:hypothetical protein
LLDLLTVVVAGGGGFVVITRAIEERDVVGLGVPKLDLLAPAVDVLAMGEYSVDGNASPVAEVLGTGASEVAPGFDGDPDSWATVDGKSEFADHAVGGVASDRIRSESPGECEDVHVSSRSVVGE